MTGEITLRGKVLPVGGIKDKVLAAFRAGITEIILPQENEKDLEEIPAEVRERARGPPRGVDGRGAAAGARRRDLRRRPPNAGEFPRRPPEPPLGPGSLAH